MDFEYKLCTTMVCDDHDVAFFPDADSGSYTVYCFLLGVCVEGEIVESSVAQTIAVVLGTLDTSDEANFCKGRDTPVNSIDAAT